MRLKLSLAIAATLASAGTAVVMSAPAAHAITCPPGTVARKIVVAGQTKTICVPGVQCDPGPCDPTAAPSQD